MNKFYTGELYHFGILGQKWGRRRYQNPDGTLTEEGKRRYADYDDHSSKRMLDLKDISRMDNDELEQLTARINLENDFHEAYSNSKGKKLFSKIGEQFVEKFSENLAETVVTSVIAAGTAAIGLKAVNEIIENE